MVRRVVAALLVVISSVLAPFAVGARWAEDTITDADQFARTIEPLADDPQVQQAVSAAASAAIISRLDVAARLERFAFLPAELRLFIAAGVNSAVSRQVEDYVQSDRFGTVWVTVAEKVQLQLVALIERDGTGAVVLEEGQIVLDTAELAAKIREQLPDVGIPGLDQLDLSRLGADIPAEIVLADTPNLQIAADAIRIFLPVASWLWAVVLAMLLAGILLWPRRSRGLMWAGLGLALGGSLAWLGLEVGTAQLSKAAADPMIGYLVTDVTRLLVRWLVHALLIMVCIGIAFIILGFLGGGTRAGRRIRDRLARSATSWGSTFADSPVAGLVARRGWIITVLQGVVLGGALVILLLMDELMPSTVVWALVIVLLLLLAVEVLAGSARARAALDEGAAEGPAPTLAMPTGPDLTAPGPN